MFRWRSIAIGVLLIVMGGFASLWYFMGKESICRASFEQIHNGMTERKVEEVLGGPARDYRKRVLGSLHIEYIGKVGKEKAWHGDLESVFVWFNEQGEVIGKDYSDNLENESLSDWLRRFLRIP